MSESRWGRALVGVMVVAGLGAACGAEFDPYFQVKALRVMAIGADKPSVGPGEQTTLEPFVFEPGGAPLTYKWSWCPFSTGSTTGYACAVEEEDLAGLGLPSFDLGTGPTAVFAYPDPPQIVPLVCEQLTQGELPDFFSAPDCERGIPILIRVEITGAGQTLTAVRELELLVGPEVVPNLNPSVGPMRAIPIGGTEADAIELGEDVPAVLERDTDYAILMDIPADSSETFLRVQAGAPPKESPEILVVSWFVEEGDLENERTGFIDGESTLFDAGRNVWRTPTIDALASSETRLFAVLRDERGGVDWLERRIVLVPQTP